MRKKLLAAAEALDGGVRTVVIGDSRRPDPVMAALRGEGTVIG
jgi:acetylglutamate/LysW-gamma-L-alpha-aminoadipate kinase